LRPLGGRCGGAVCSRGGNAAEWDRGSVRAGGCGRVDGVARRGQARGGGSRVVRDRCLDFLRAKAKCSSLCKITKQDSGGSYTNPGGGTMTISYVGLSPGICWCETPPCRQLLACSGSIKIEFDDHVSWQTYVPDAKINGVPTPICADPGSGSNDPPDHFVQVSMCGRKEELLVTQWKMRWDPKTTFDIDPDITGWLDCSSCVVQNCQ